QAVVEGLERRWNTAVRQVPRVDPDATDGGSGDLSAVTDIVTVLAQTATPVEFTLRELDDKRGTYVLKEGLHLVLLDAGLRFFPQIEADLVDALEGANILEERIAAYDAAYEAIRWQPNNTSLSDEEREAA